MERLGRIGTALWGVALALSLVLVGCNAFDRGLLGPSAPIDSRPDADGGVADGGGEGGTSGGSGGTGGMNSGGTSGGGSGGMGAGEGGNGPPPGGECEVPPPDADPSCIQVCPETCNDADDDCDGEIDEDPASSACALDHALSACIGGECLITDCTDGFRNCDAEHETGCETPADDVDHCGMCRNKCVIPGAIEGCVEDECVAIGCDELRGDCTMASDDCESTLTTLENCGDCGQGCEELPNATGLSCSSGECKATTCALGYDDCNTSASDGCEQILNDVEHCTACDQSCDLVGSSGDDCDEFVCRAGPCDDGYGDCDGDRLDGCEPLSTTDNCGACGQVCGGTDLENIEGATCDTGECVPDCNPGFGSCDEDPFNGCESSIWQTDRCGDCDSPCVLDHATPTCPSGSCEIEVCANGWDDCNDDPSDGCETSLNDDQTCGSCENDCTSTTDPVCSGGACGDVTCPDPNTADCPQDGLPCEIDLTNDELNCGACNAPCAFTTGAPNASALECVARACEATCEPGFEDCNRDYRDGCETPLNSNTHCGACNTACSIANATEECSTGQCLVVACTADFRDCDMDQRSCERSINTVTDCGACNAACSLMNASATCGGTPGARACGVSSCSQFFANCDGVAGNGCEVNVQTDTDDCGVCDYDCNAEDNVASATCGGGSCTFTCDSGYRDCNNQDADGCEIALNTNANCGSCGATCARANATTSCSTGACQIVSCNGSFDQCDGNLSNGCESLQTVTHCGGCNNACLPPNATGTCTTGTCQVSTCASGWDNCDGDPANGCERNTSTLGPCLPESDCVKRTYSGFDYYMCPTPRSWAEARTRCQLQSFGDLARLDDAAEVAFVGAAITTRSWTGATDGAPTSVEGEWRWANDGVLLWTGTAGGVVAPGRYAQWSSGEPNDFNGNEDCMEILQGAGNWNDQPCSSTRGYVCEVAGDLCPEDPAKTSPGQCGCGNADTDDDGDRTANCTDGCPSDASKVAGGVCGCNVSDADGDGDGTPNCNDLCPTDGTKTSAGQCGCNVADTDGDGDGTANCNDLCPTDGSRMALPCAYPYTPSNYTPGTLDFDTAPSSTLNCGSTVTVDTSAAVTITGWCGTLPVPVVRTQTGGPEVAILPLQGLTIPAGTTLRVIGSRPLILAVNGNATVAGIINARGAGNTPGAGGNVSCGAGAIGDNGGHDGTSDDGDGGGAGGAFGSNGSSGGSGDNGSGGGAASTAEGVNTLLPLRGGCQGGQGGRSSAGAEGGGGGGALSLSVSGTLTVSTGARISASGGGGRRGGNGEDGGGGGGSGGAVFLEAGTLSIASGAWVTANGGGGSSGNGSGSADGQAGTDGIDNGSGTTAGGTGSNAAGNGGVGAGASSGAGGGGNGTCDGGFFCLGSTRGAGGGGGGGGVGRVRYRGVTACTINQGASPTSLTTCP